MGAKLDLTVPSIVVQSSLQEILYYAEIGWQIDPLRNFEHKVVNDLADKHSYLKYENRAKVAIDKLGAVAHFIELI